MTMVYGYPPAKQAGKGLSYWSSSCTGLCLLLNSLYMQFLLNWDHVCNSPGCARGLAELGYAEEQGNVSDVL